MQAQAIQGVTPYTKPEGGFVRVRTSIIGLTWWPNKIVTVRPELRFDHSYDTAAFNNGTRKNQFVFSMDFILHYL